MPKAPTSTGGRESRPVLGELAASGALALAYTNQAKMFQGVSRSQCNESGLVLCTKETFQNHFHVLRHTVFTAQFPQ
jgi:hypothetical protein